MDESELQPFTGEAADEESLLRLARSCVGFLRNTDDWEQQSTGLQQLQRLAIFEPQILALDAGLYKTLLGWAVRCVGSLRSALSKRAAQTLSELFVRLGPDLNVPLTGLLIPALMKRASDNTSAFIRQHARTALESFCSKCSSKEVLMQLERFLHHANPLMRETALFVMQDCLVSNPELRGVRNVDQLIRDILQDANPQVRRAAAGLQEFLQTGKIYTPVVAPRTTEGGVRDPHSTLPALPLTSKDQPKAPKTVSAKKKSNKPSLIPKFRTPKTREGSTGSTSAQTPSTTRTQFSPKRSQRTPATSPTRTRKPITSPKTPALPAIQTHTYVDNSAVSMAAWRQLRAENQLQQTRGSPSKGHPRFIGSPSSRTHRPAFQVQGTLGHQIATSPNARTGANKNRFRKLVAPRADLESNQNSQNYRSQNHIKTALTVDGRGESENSVQNIRNDFASPDHDNIADFEFDYGVNNNQTEATTTARMRTEQAPEQFLPPSASYLADDNRYEPQNLSQQQQNQRNKEAISLHGAAQAAVRPVVLRGIVTPVDHMRLEEEDIWGPTSSTSQERSQQGILGCRTTTTTTTVHNGIANSTDRNIPPKGVPRNATRKPQTITPSFEQIDQHELALWKDIAELDQRLTDVRSQTHLRQVRVAGGIDALPPELGLSPAGASIYAQAVSQAPPYKTKTSLPY